MEPELFSSITDEIIPIPKVSVNYAEKCGNINLVNVFRAQAENKKAACATETSGKGKGNTASTLKEQQRLGVFSSIPGSRIQRCC